MLFRSHLYFSGRKSESESYISYVKFRNSLHREHSIIHCHLYHKYININLCLSSVVCKGDVTEKFPVQTGVRQGCVLSPFLFLFAIDCIMKERTNNRRNGIQWSLLDQLDDLDFADDLALLSHKTKPHAGKKHQYWKKQLPR